MKSKIFTCVVIVFIVIIITGIITNYVDSGRVTTGHEPQYCIKIVNNDKSKITYLGLGYKVVRYVKDSVEEPYGDNIGVKMGNWFMEYNLPKEKNIVIEYDDKIVKIINHNDINKIYNILMNSKYEAPICDGINSHKISVDDEIYYLKESCKEIQKGENQATISQEDLNIIFEIIDNNQ